MNNKLVAAALLASAAPVAPAVAQSAPAFFTTGYRYDAERQLTGTIAPLADNATWRSFPAVRNTYDPAGRLTKVEKGELVAWQSEAVAPANWTGFTVHTTLDTAYDALDRKLTEKMTGSDGKQTLTQYGYDNAGRLECTAIRMNPAIYASLPASACTLGTEGSFGPDRITKNHYDVAGQLLKVQEGVGTAIVADEATYTYSPNGKRTSMTDANGNRAEMTYDGHDRQARWIFPSKTAPGQTDASDYEEYGYDANGNRTALRKRDGRVLGFSYDALNRVTVKTVPDGGGLPAAATRDVYYSYDNRGLQTHARFDSHAGEGIVNSFDGFGRLTASTSTMDGVSRTLTHWYDANGNRTGLTHADGAFFGHAYDGLDRFGYSMDAASAFPVQHAYNNRQLYALVYGSGYGVNYAYDGLDRPTNANHTAASTVANVAFTYARNPASQIAALTRDNDAFAWVGHGSGSQAYAVNGLNQYTSIAGAAQSHDANGNLTGDGSSSFTYDVENRLIAAMGAVTASLAYDPLGRLYQVSSGTSIRRFLYDRDAMVAEYDASGTMLRRYLHGPGVDDPLAWYEGAGLTDRRALHADERGSIIAVTDAAGNGIAINAYDEYGRPQTRPIANGTPGAITSNALTGTFGYTGQIWLPEIKAYYYKNRLYDPQRGRFYQVDPIGYEGGNNLYAYTLNDPVNLVDSEGDQPRSARQRPSMGNRPPRDPYIVPAITRIERRIMAMDPQYRRPQVIGSLTQRDVSIAQQNLRDRSLLGFGGSSRGENLNDAAMHMVLGRAEYVGPTIGGARGTTYQFSSTGNAGSDFNFLTGGNFTSRSQGALVSRQISLGNGNEVTYNLHTGTGLGRSGTTVLEGRIRSTLPGSRIMRSTTFKVEYNND